MAPRAERAAKPVNKYVASLATHILSLAKGSAFPDFRASDLELLGKM
jgi:hypothetical protein